MKKNYLRLICLLGVCLFSAQIYAQGFINIYTLPDDHGGQDLYQMPDGGFLITGTGLTSTFLDPFVMRTDANGDTLWVKYPGTPGYGVTVNDMSATPDGNFVVCGEVGSTPVGSTMYWLKFDAQGNTIWEHYLNYPNGPGPGNLGCYGMNANSDGSLIFVGKGPSNDGALVVKTDSLGDTLWTRRFYLGGNNWAYGSMEASDGSHIITGANRLSSTTYPFLIKLSPTGNVVWQTVGTASGSGVRILELPSGNFVVASRFPCRLNKFSANGTWLSGQQIEPQFETDDAILTHDNKVAICGLHYSTMLGGDTFGLIIADTNYNILVNKLYVERNSATFQQYAEMGLVETADHGFAMTHTYSPNSTFPIDPLKVILIRTDSLGNAYTNMVRGNIYADANSNCTYDVGDFPRLGWTVELDGGQAYGYTDANGYYEIEMGPGSHVIKLLSTHPYLSPLCPAADSIAFSFATTNDTLSQQDFALSVDNPCPYMTVDLSSNRFRPGLPTTFTATYCNTGFINATNVRVEIELDTFFVVQSSVPVLTALGGNVFETTIPSVPAGACGTITITALANLNTPVGATLCNEARIYPDTICGPVDTIWDRSSVQVNGFCQDSLACFTVRNTGDPTNGNMAGPTQWRLYENGVLVQTGTVQIAGGQDTVLCFPANGNTIRLEVDQRPGHPGNSRPNDSVERCGTNSSGGQTLGLVNAFPQNNGDPFVDVFCREVVNSFDPNEKLVFPSGFDTQHFIDKDHENFYYEIHFQNTGTAPAINVILKDTLPAELDLGSLRLVGSSHPYTDFQILPGRILQWRFINIYLPDSTNNEPESHGHVSFRIKQNGGYTNGTKIENRAGIYFDFNDPVITDYAFVTLHDTVIGVFVHPQFPDVEVQLTAFPNPGTGLFNFRLSGLPAVNGLFDLEVYGLDGQRIAARQWDGANDLSLDISSFPRGMYIFRLSKGGEHLGSGKLMKQ